LFWKNVLSFHPFVRLPEFLIGMLAGRLFLVGRRESRLAPALVLGGLFGMAIVIALVDRIPNPVISTGFLSPAFAAIIYGLALRPRWSSFLEARWLVLLGDASYSLYLLHSIVITRVFRVTPFLPWGIRVAISLGAAIGASLVSYEWIEKPGRRMLGTGRRRQCSASGS
jgi:peptidoglycan/LPS O-acetylase OafA/YrhL